MLDTSFLVGVDVGSTTVKAVVMAEDGAILWREYRRHETHQAEVLVEFLQQMEREIGIAPGNCRFFLTGSGAAVLADPLGARFVQEVNAVALAVEKLHPQVQSVIELGGQDAKILVIKIDPRSGQRRKFSSMNDKCAGGTGAVIDKIQAKLRIPADQLPELAFRGTRIHPVAGKCGVFAETDINGLQKQGIPAEELMASLYEAIVLQNLTVLTRGHTLLPHVLLLGGPNAFLRGMREAWQHHLALLWQERGTALPLGFTVEELVQTPPNALYYAALAAIEFGRQEADLKAEASGHYRGSAALIRFLEADDSARKIASGSQSGLCSSKEELQSFRDRYQVPPFLPATFQRGEKVAAFLGLDGGSTSTKAVLLAANGTVLAKAYRLSEGNPIADSQAVLGDLRRQVEEKSYASLQILGLGVTGYAKEILRLALQADVALVETVAHTNSALHFFRDPQVIVDVGGQDIKLILLHEGRVRDFKINAQCSAGNGYFLQATAESLGIPVERYAEIAFAAQAMPTFGYGCAVFLQSDIANFQRQGWKAEEILAGLATVLPRNIFLNVAKMPNLTALGSRFILQGGTQNNLAAVKAQVDFLRTAFRSTGIMPEIVVHPHCGEAGAIGAALEAIRLHRPNTPSSFIGMEAVSRIRYTTTSNEETRCRYCKNACPRTLLEVHFDGDTTTEITSRRILLANCEKGAAENLESVRSIQTRLDATRNAHPNLVEIATHKVWLPRHPESAADSPPSRIWKIMYRHRMEVVKRRSQIRIGIPRVLSFYAYAPLFSAYLESLGILAKNIIYSEVTTNELYRAGSSAAPWIPAFHPSSRSPTFITCSSGSTRASHST